MTEKQRAAMWGQTTENRETLVNRTKTVPAPPSPHCHRGGVSPAPPPACILSCAPPPPRGAGAAGVGEGPQCGAMQGNGGWHLGRSTTGARVPTALETDGRHQSPRFPTAHERPASGSGVLRRPKTPARTRGRRHHQRRRPSSGEMTKRREPQQGRGVNRRGVGCWQF
jgi:hypothetical protein